MSFHIRTALPALQRELEQRLASLEDQLAVDRDYEIAAEVLPAEHAIERAKQIAGQIGAQAVYVAAGTFEEKKAVVEVPIQQVHEDRTADDAYATLAEREQRTGEVACATQVQNDQRLVSEPRTPRLDLQKLWLSVVRKSAWVRALAGRAAANTGSFLKTAQSSSSEALRRSAIWSSARGSEAKIGAGELQRSLAVKTERFRQVAAEWNARRLERRAAESRARAERKRAAHREAELAASAASAMRHQQEKEAAQRQVRQVKPHPAPAVALPRVHAAHDRESWPIWRNAFAAAACLVGIGIFLLAGGKQTKASSETSSELTKPAVVVPEVAVPPVSKATSQAAAQPARKIAKPSARAHVARTADDSDFQEVIVRHYPTNLPLAPPKRDPKGVVQISDME